MGAPGVEAERRFCSVHTDRQAVGRCERCGRPACLACAIPFRGRLLCVTCAAEALGVPPAPPDPAPGRSGPDVVAGGLFIVALLVSILPWHRFGALTRPWAAWALGRDGWAAATCYLLVVAVLLLAVSAVVRSPRGGTLALAAAIAAALAAGSAVRAILGAPDFWRQTPTPYAIAVLAGLGALLAAMRVRRARKRAG